MDFPKIVIIKKCKDWSRGSLFIISSPFLARYWYFWQLLLLAFLWHNIKSQPLGLGIKVDDPKPYSTNFKRKGITNMHIYGNSSQSIGWWGCSSWKVHSFATFSRNKKVASLFAHFFSPMFTRSRFMKRTYSQNLKWEWI